MRFSKLISWSAALLAIAVTATALLPPARTRGFDIDRFARLPVLEGGRVKPIDSVARNSLLLVRGQQSFTWQGRTMTADEWLLDVLFRPEVADSQPVFVIDDPEVLGLLGLRQTPDRYFSFRALEPGLAKIEQQATVAREIDSRQRTRFQGAIVNLFERLYLHYRLQNTMQGRGDLAGFRPLPPPPGARADAWRTVGEAGSADPGLARIGDAYAKQDAALFNVAVAAFEASVEGERSDAAAHARYEVLFNRAAPFYAGMVIYLLALLVLFGSFLGKREMLKPAAFGLVVAGALVHTLGLASRIALQGRPPVTNLYSSAVFVGFCAVVVAIFLERIYRRGIGTAVAAAAGFASLIVAHHLRGDGDTMEMMRAVLDSNFWLATHVVTITIGYSGTFLAGALAIGYAFRRHFAPRLDPATTRALVSMTYGVICFALLFSFVGTVLGGIWADQSWGRFWGWDPKENGALLIVLWNALILHARWGGYVREKGVMAMAIFGNVITSLSWFGVNMLGVGLHSYGFMEGAVWSLSGFIVSQLLIMALALLPRRFWQPQLSTP
jgi:ABC-type transport system involved in cytochrome c biogenesis permease subunit